MNEPADPSIDRLLKGWPLRLGSVQARRIPRQRRADALQMRIEMGLLQLEISGRPDGARPSGYETYLDALLARAVRDPHYELTEDDRQEADRELLQFHQRRLCWLALREFRPAVADADHTLALMDFIVAHAPQAEWRSAHEPFRPLVLFHRAQAASGAELEDCQPEEAIDALNDGLDRLRDFFLRYSDADAFEADDLVGQLRELRESLRSQYEVGPTLRERLSEAIAAEQYELAARLRDEMARRRS